jgi:hypothetical protein
MQQISEIFSYFCISLSRVRIKTICQKAKIKTKSLNYNEKTMKSKTDKNAQNSATELVEITKQKEHKIVKFLIKKKYYVGLILIIFIILIWQAIKVHNLETSFAKKKSELISSYELKLDNLNMDRMKLTAKTFSWAIRSELMRENKEQINQYFNEFIKTPDIIKLQLINPDNSTIEIATDKKDEGIKNSDYSNIKKQVINSDASEFRIVTPITGLNKKIGIFVIDVNKYRK